MKKTFAALAIAALTAVPFMATTPAFAESHAASGDAGAGEKVFRQCQSCHVVVNDAGETLAGRNAKTGPNLYKVAGRTAGSIEGFKYSESMAAAGAAGLVWTEETLSEYVQDPTAFLRKYLDDKSARGAMSFKVRKETDAVNVYAYLAGL